MFWVQEILCPKIVGKIIWLETYEVKKSFWNLPLKFGQNWVGNSWDIPDMDKCHQDKCWQDKYHHNGWNLLKLVPGAYL